MITFKPIIIPNNRRKDGTYPVKIRVTYKGKTRRLPTNLVCRTSDLTRTLHIKNADILSKADQLIRQMRKAVEDLTAYDLEDRDVEWIVNRIKDKLTKQTFHLDFFAFADEFILTKKEPTREVYKSALNYFSAFLGKREIDVNDISKALLLDFVDYVNNLPKMYWSKKDGKLIESKVHKSEASSTRYIAKLQHIFNAIKAKYNDEDEDRLLIPKSPFDSIPRVYLPSKGQDNLGVELMQMIISAQTNNPLVRIALDTLVVGFALYGVALVDLYFATPFDGDWEYQRMKVKDRRADGAWTRASIPPEIAPYVARLQEYEGKSKWWLPALHYLAGNQHDHCSRRINQGIKMWCKENNIPPFTYYAIRHTWSSLARKAGVEKAVIDECLVHKGDYAITDIYTDTNWELHTDAQRRVIEMFQW